MGNFTTYTAQNTGLIHFSADTMLYHHLSSCGWLRKNTIMQWSVPFKVIIDHWFWYRSKARMRLPTTLFVINSNIGPISRLSRDTAKVQKSLPFPIPSHLTLWLAVSHFEFLDKAYLAKTRILGLSAGEYHVILACVVLTQYQCETDRHLDDS